MIIREKNNHMIYMMICIKLLYFETRDYFKQKPKRNHFCNSSQFPFSLDIFSNTYRYAISGYPSESRSVHDWFFLLSQSYIIYSKTDISIITYKYTEFLYRYYIPTITNWYFYNYIQVHRILIYMLLYFLGYPSQSWSLYDWFFLQSHSARLVYH